MRKPKKKKSIAKRIKKVLPAEVVAAMFSTGVGFAANDINMVEVMVNGQIMRYDLTKVQSDEDYADAVKNAVKEAFTKGDTFIAQTSTGAWVDLGNNFSEGLSFDVMLENPTYFEGTPTVY